MRSRVGCKQTGGGMVDSPLLDTFKCQVPGVRCSDGFRGARNDFYNELAVEPAFYKIPDDLFERAIDVV